MRALLVWLMAVGVASAKVVMPGIFGDHMVLQQDVKLPVWGWAEPGESLKVTLGHESLSATAAPDGSWRVEFPPQPRPAEDASTTLTIEGKNTLTYQDVLIGDVWIASGQSNMAFGLSLDSRGKAAMETANFPRLRFFHVAQATALDPLRGDALQGTWMVCSPQTLRDGGPSGFSAAAFYFAREIQRVNGHSIGLIGTYWGGTPAEAWTSLAGLGQEPALKPLLEVHQKLAAEFASAARDYDKKKADYDAAAKAWYAGPGKAYYKAAADWQVAANQASAAGQPIPPKPRETEAKPLPPIPPDGGQSAPGNLFNAMIAPIIPYAIKGVIWYQGEANTRLPAAADYPVLFKRLITDWREKWAQGNFPFLFVQLAGLGMPPANPAEAGSALVREGQRLALALPATGMASATDIGDPYNIHPKDKWDVGLRLALAARRVAYGENLVSSGPLYESMKVEGNKVRLSFTEVGGGLVMGVPPWTSNGKPPAPPTELTGFALAGPDRHWYWAKAEIDGNTVVVSCDKTPQPVAVRYGWAGNPGGNLYNKEGLPASPFRTDDGTDTSRK